MSRVIDLFSDEYAVSGMIGILRKIFWRTVSAFYALTLHAPGLKVNSFLKVIGGRHISFGKNVFINGGIWIECVGRYGDKKFSPSIEIGEGTCCSERVHISAANHIVIGRGVLFGSNIYVSDNGHGAYRGTESSSPEVPPALRPLNVTGEVIIGNNVWIGDNCVLLAPVCVGDGSIIGANSVVKGDIPAGEIWAGAPARCIKYFDQESKQWIPRK